MRENRKIGKLIIERRRNNENRCKKNGKTGKSSSKKGKQANPDEVNT